MNKEKLRQAIKDNMPSMVVIAGLFVMIVLFFWPRIFITVQSGEAAVLYRRFLGGTVTDRVYGEGLHIIPPWDTLYVYDVRVKTELRELTALTKRGMPVKVDFAIRYFPIYETLGLLHQEIGPDYLQKVVIPETEAILRETIGQHLAEGIYAEEQSINASLLQDSLEKVVRRYVRIESVVIYKVELPEAINRVIQEKVTQEEIVKAYEYKLQTEQKEARRKEIEAGGIKTFNEIVDSSLTDRVLTLKGVEATRQIATSDNAKVVVIGAGKEGLPVILNTGDAPAPADLAK